MSWDYRVIRDKDICEEYFYAIHEVHCDEDKDITGTRLSWTEQPCNPVGASRKDLVKDLELMLRAFEKPTLDMKDLRGYYSNPPVSSLDKSDRRDNIKE